MSARKTIRNENRPGYKKSKVGWIPEEWECVLIEDIAQRATGHTPDKKKPAYWNGGIKWVSLADSNKLDKPLIKNTAKEISKLGIKNSSAKLLPKGTVILLRDAGVGRSTIIGEVMAVSQHFVAWICGENIFNLYLYYYLQSQKRKFERQAIGSTIVTIGMGYFRHFKIPLPPLPEQKKIAEILSAWNRAIEQVGKLIDAKERLKKGLMQQLLTGRMRFAEFGSAHERIKTHFYDFPLDWKHPRIAEIALEISERNIEQIDYPVLSCSKYDGFVNSLEYFGKKVYSDDTSNYKVIKRGQFGFPSNHIEEGSIGLLKHIDAGIVSPIYTIFETNPEKVFTPYLYALFKTKTYQHVFRVNTNSSVDRRGSLRWKEFSKIRVPLPPLTEQTRIATVLTTCDKEINLLKKKRGKLKEQKKGLMQKLLTGEIRVKI